MTTNVLHNPKPLGACDVASSAVPLDSMVGVSKMILSVRLSDPFEQFYRAKTATILTRSILTRFS